MMKFWPPNFRRLVLFCTDSYDSESRRIFSHFSRSTRITILCTAQISKFQQKIVQNFGGMNNFHFISFYFIPFFLMNLANFLQKFHQILPEFHGNAKKIGRYTEMLVKVQEEIGEHFRIFLFQSFLRDCSCPRLKKSKKKNGNL